ncbi:MAG TPA: NUDIX domain-containing protein [Thermoanaerobaculia bacterium]|jgi:isopentenyldiphosphate isomerase|nr:NUDIX domain-containing protein [Thermoanaerobaculia bacterium]
MELIDVLTPDGAFTGVIKPKADVHRDGDWHRSAHVWIIAHNDCILVQRRALTKENNPGLWDVSCAGHIAAGESAVEAAIREANEELGIDIAADDLRHVATLWEPCVLNDGTYIDNEIHEIYVVRRDVDVRTLRLQADEVDEVRLVTREELRALDLVPHAQEYALLFGLECGGHAAALDER